MWHEYRSQRQLIGRANAAALEKFMIRQGRVHRLQSDKVGDDVCDSENMFAFDKRRDKMRT